MLTIRKATDRGVTNFGWLDSKHTFSFGDYHDPKHTHFRTLRVINDDIIAGGGQFGSHPHRDMEIFYLRPERVAGTPGQHGERVRDSGRRMAIHVRRNRRDAQRGEPLPHGAGSPACKCGSSPNNGI